MFIFKSVWVVLLDLVETLVIAGAVFVVIYAFLFRPFQVNGQSMFPNYHNGEYILTNLIVLKFDKLERGEVVVFKSPTNQEKDFIKRIIGLPGETVSLKNGAVLVNGKVLDESSYLPPDYKTYGGAFLSEGNNVTVPDGSFFVLGDNRGFSSDSREWGFVSKDKLIGKSFVVYWPPQDFKLVQQGKYNQ